ncbi:MMPL family transporter [Glycomyces algeriensis]|uniref:Membrane protein n=1 Tax=Glycomyces algeriensis TaxID=256037 RepID=A0A9W6G4S3_9ACTN|nr:MMPL family transporter [Glycomyces algeriensis]MDA1368091.1 MMPL family transporter [Glycomyces algeriensis]MDR7352603.1 RND superfamily putative drug exporter [Glycomyces algeriensis]GLI40283.1 membrane protein [Glycomyces algeriensis]
MSTRTASPPTGSTKRSPTVRIASWSAANPWKAILAWTVFVAVCFGAGTAAGTNQVAFSDYWIGEAGDAETLALENGLSAPAVEQLLITSPDGALDAETAAAAAADLRTRMGALDEVAEVTESVTAESGDALMLAVTMSMPAHEANEHIDPLLEVTAAVQESHPDLDIAQTGGKSMSNELDDQLGSQLGQVERFTLPITLAILFIVFGSLLLAGVPLLLAISSIVAALGVYALSSHFFPDAGGAVTSVLAMIGMAVGVDYSLFYLKRVREERKRSGGTADLANAVELAAETAGRTIVTSGIAVIVSLAGLYLVDDVIFSSIATACIIVVAIAVISSLTVLPALLAKTGRRIDGGKLLRRKVTAPDADREGRVWSALLRPSLRHPVATAVIGLVVVGGLALPALAMTTSVEGRESFPKSLDSIAAYDALTAEFPNAGLAHSIVAQVDPADADALAAAAADLEQRTRGNALFAPTDTSRLRFSDDATAIRLDLPVPYATSDPRAAESLALLRDDLVPATIGQVPGVEYAVSGEPAYASDYADHQSARLPLVVGFVLAATFVVMLIAFRSVVFALLSMLLNLLSTLAAWGALVLVFQHTWAEGLLDFDSPGFIGSRTPLLVFAILFGLSLDYQLFVMSRIKEAALGGAAPRDAIHQGIKSSASVVTSAAVIMMSVFVAFVFIDRIEMKQLGFALALGVLLDAVIVRVMLLPALMAMVDRAGRWPAAWRPKAPAVAR